MSFEAESSRTPFPSEDCVQHEVKASCFATRSGARLDYALLENGRIDITHTFVPENLRGRKLAARLMEAALHYASREGLQIQASCSYAEAYLKRKR